VSEIVYDVSVGDWQSVQEQASVALLTAGLGRFSGWLDEGNLLNVGELEMGPNMSRAREAEVLGKWNRARAAQEGEESIIPLVRIAAEDSTGTQRVAPKGLSAPEPCTRPVTTVTATSVNESVFWSGRQGLNRAAAEASGLTTLEKTRAGIALESQDLFSKLPYSEAIKPWEALSEQFASEAKGTVNAWTGGASPVSVWNRLELPALLRNPEVRRIIIHDATQPWKTRIIYK